MNQNLQKQLNKLCRQDKHNNGFLTRRTYRARMANYLDWASDRGLQKIQNIKNKSVQDYVNEQIDRGLSERTLKTTLAAIRYFNKLACGFSNVQSKFTVRNAELGIGGKDTYQYREGISEAELDSAIKYAEGDVAIESALLLGYHLGLRSNEIYNLRLYELKDLLNGSENQIQISHGTKGGKQRTVLFNEQARHAVMEAYEKANGYNRSPREKVLCGGEKGDCKRVLAKWHNWWSRNAERIAEDAGVARQTQLSAHCLRRQYARNLFDDLVRQGRERQEAAKDVSEALGHGRGRTDITALYLGFRV